MASCLRKTRTVLSIVKALISRGLFTLHGLICIWRVTLVQRNPIYWALAGTFPLMMAETLYTLCKKKDGEWKWICPSVLLYLGTAVPAIWFLELDLMRQRLMIGQPRRQPVLALNSSREFHLLHGQIQFAMALGSEEWCKILEQMLLLVLIVGRWLLPKGEITREQLSQLLLVYIGMAADIIELFEAFKEKTVRENRLLTMIILSLWTGSLSQFTLVVTAAKSKKTRPVVFRSSPASASCGKSSKSCCPTEVLSIMISVFLQDAPFLVLRMLLIFRYEVVSYTNIFFTSKNTLVLSLQIYRLIVLFSDKPKKSGKSTEKNETSCRSSTTSGSLTSSSESDNSCSESDSYDTDSYHSNGKRYRKSKHHHSWMTTDSPKTGSSSVDVGDTNHSFDREPRSHRKHKTGNAPSSNHVTSRTDDRHFSESSVTKTPKTKHKSPPKVKDGVGSKRDNRKKREKDKNKMVDRGERRKDRGQRDQNEDGDFTPASKRSHKMSPEVEKQVKKIEERNKTSSPLPPPPPPPLPQDTYSDIDSSDNDLTGDHDVDHMSKKKHSKTDKLKSSPKNDPHDHHHSSPQASSRKHQDGGRTSKQHHHNHQSHNSSSPKKHWKAVKNLRSALTFLDEKGIFRTVVLKPMGDGSSIYVVDNDYGDDVENGQVIVSG